ncbi:sensor histidine kinase [Sphingomicrobium marinum]|uniref:sensor histidine kinase n=1 Tax=Sphingomicrobium marinum TaxID=1227950 RepID=UPI00223F9224|nr:HAMP domain-containing sensor histidine kinase [Sphingomicrobium marinum]
MNPRRTDEDVGKLRWSRRFTLVHRILALNLFTLLTLALTVIWLDTYRNQLRDERVGQLANKAQSAAEASVRVPEEERESLLAAIGAANGTRLRLYGPDGEKLADSWNVVGPTYRLRDPAEQPWTLDAARIIDRAFNAVVGADPIERFAEPEEDVAASWPEIAASRESGIATYEREAPERTPVFSAAARTNDDTVVLATINDRDYTDIVRRERASLALALLAATILSVLLSLFLARTIARPLRHIAVAAHRVRLGRAREVKVPRLPSRRDEIGQLARSISDMSQSLSARIDQMDAFAADVAHELKNPLASLRSAVDGLDNIEDPALRKQLLDVVRQDVVRLDRLVGDIAEAARTDADMARAQFEKVDLGMIACQMVASWQERRGLGDITLTCNRPEAGSLMVAGDESRLARVIDNLIDNALSFAPPKSEVSVEVKRIGNEIRVAVADEGPGVPDDEREAIFKRFHSRRPETEDFGRHSGLGLAIAAAIVKAHEGRIGIMDRTDGKPGAIFALRLPAWGSE